LLWTGKIRLQVFLTAPERGHEADAVVFRNCTDPAFLTNIAPPRKPQDCSGFDVSFSRKKKKLHLFVGDPDLRDAPCFLVIENAATDWAKMGDFSGNVVVFQSVFKKKQIA